MNFDTALKLLLNHEGDFSDHKEDKGGATRYGVTEAEARRVGYRGDMRELPLDLAKQIFKRDYWDKIKADELPVAVRYALFDAAVNSGVPQATRWLQRACGVKDDGIIGPVTIAAAHHIDGARLKSSILAQRLRFMASLTNWPAFSRGWSRRIADLMES